MSTLFNAVKWGMKMLPLLVLLFSQPGIAQLSGTFTIGTSGNYSTLTAAVEDLVNQGVNGAVTFNILNGNYQEQIRIGNINGVNAANRITFQSQSGNAADVQIFYSASGTNDNYVIKLDSAKFISFKNLTILAANNSFGRVFHLVSPASDIQIMGNIIAGNNNNSSSTNLALIIAENSSINNLQIINNTFTDGAYAVYLIGLNASNPFSGLEILDNTLTAAYMGIRLQHSSGSKINGNLISLYGSGAYAFYLTDCNGGLEIIKNKFTLSNAHAIYFANSTGGSPPLGTRGLIANNFISVSSSGGHYGFYLQSISNQDFYFNSVNFSNGGAGSRAFSLDGNGSNNNVVNNNFANLGSGYAYYANSSAGIATSNYNNLFSLGNFLAYWNDNRVDLAAFISANGKDANSLSVFPHFTSNSDLHTTAPWLNGKGTPLGRVTDDIDGEARNGTNPDIGADEFTPDPNSTTPLAGSYTIGVSGNYTDINAALNDLLLKGMSGSINFNIISGTYIESANLYSIAGQSNTDSITITSQSGNASDAIWFYAANSAGDNYTLRLRNAKNVVIKNLTMGANNTTTASYGRVIAFTGANKNVKIIDNILAGTPTSGSTDNMATIHSDNAIINSLEILNNNFSGGSYSIYLIGASANLLSTGIRIINNEISGAYMGIRMQNTDGLKINQNNILLGGGGAYAFYLTECNGGLEIIKNKFTLSNAHAIYFANSTGGSPPLGTRGLIANNFISVTSSGGHYGFYLQSISNQDFYFNSVNFSNGGAGSRAFSLDGNGSNNNVVNNNFANLGSGYAYYANSSAGIGTSDHNNLFSLGNFLAYWNGNRVDLDAFISANGKDANSLSVFPHFTSNSDLHTTAPWLNGKGTPLGRVTDDIDGEARNGTNPDIGADEFTPDPNSTTPLAGNYTIGASGDYQTIQAAFAALLLRGASGSITYNIMPGTYNERVNLYEAAGMSSSDTITIQSMNGNSAEVIWANAPTAAGDNYTLRLRNAKNVVIKNLTISSSNSNSSSFGNVLTFSGNVSNVLIENNRLVGFPNASSSDNLAIISSSGDYLQDIKIKNNQFSGGSYSVYLIGISVQLPASGIEIVDNTISGTYMGIRLSNMRSPKINSNNFMLSNQADYGMYLTSCDGEMEIMKNKIIINSGHGIYLNASTGGSLPLGKPGLIANNFLSTGGSNRYGFYFSTLSNQNIYNNSVNIYNASTNSRCFYIDGNGSDVNVVNNIFSNKGGGFAYYAQTTTSISTSDFNDLHTTGDNVAYWGNNRATLSDLQDANGKENNSISVDPFFVSNTNLHSKSPDIDSAGTPLAEIIDDIDGDLRDPNMPDIGADEFVFGLNTPPTITSMPDTIAYVNTQYSYQVVAEDIDGDTLVYSLQLSPGWLNINTSTGLVIGTPAQNNIGSANVTIAVNDGNGGLIMQEFTIHVMSTTGVEDLAGQIPDDFILYQNYPNPFNPVTAIRFGLPQSSFATIEIYNIAGEKVAEIFKGELNAGYHEINFDASKLSSGIYLYRIYAKDFISVKKMVLLK
jgi:hypothetical protein